MRTAIFAFADDSSPQSIRIYALRCSVACVIRSGLISKLMKDCALEGRQLLREKNGAEIGMRRSCAIIGGSGIYTAPMERQELACPRFFRKFALEDFTRATLTITGLGLYRAYLNGKCVGEDYLTPGYNDYTGL